MYRLWDCLNRNSLSPLCRSYRVGAECPAPCYASLIIRDHPHFVHKKTNLVVEMADPSGINNMLVTVHVVTRSIKCRLRQVITLHNRFLHIYKY